MDEYAQRFVAQLLARTKYTIVSRSHTFKHFIQAILNCIHFVQCHTPRKIVCCSTVSLTLPHTLTHTNTYKSNDKVKTTAATTTTTTARLSISRDTKFIYVNIATDAGQLSRSGFVSCFWAVRRTASIFCIIDEASQ